MPRRWNLKSRRPPARHGTCGLPRQQQSRLAIPCSGSGSRSSGRLRSAKGVARPHGCWRGKGIARPEAAARAEAVVARPGRARLDVGGSSSAADCLRRRSPAAVRANRQGRANVVRRRRRVAHTAQPRQRAAPGRRPLSLSRAPEVKAESAPSRLYEGAALVKALCQYSDTLLADCRVSAVVSSVTVSVSQAFPPGVALDTTV